MKKEFLNKKICFLGGSNIQHGTFLTYLRSVLPKEIYLFNRGLGGNRAEMACALLQDEILNLKPDYCFVLYGTNDVGIWLYDQMLEKDESAIAERKNRDERFLKGIEETVKALKTAGVKPVLMSPWAVDELLIEKTDIQTVADNKEKEKRVTSDIYTRSTFRNINKKLGDYAEKVKAISERENLDFIDLYSNSYLLLQKDRGLFGEDGIHLTDYGHQTFAKWIFEYLVGNSKTVVWQKSARALKIEEMEAAERRVQYVKWAMFHPILGYDHSNLECEIEKLLKGKATLSPQRHANIETYLHYKGDINALRERIWNALTQEIE